MLWWAVSVLFVYLFCSIIEISTYSRLLFFCSNFQISVYLSCPIVEVSTHRWESPFMDRELLRTVSCCPYFQISAFSSWSIVKVSTTVPHWKLSGWLFCLYLIFRWSIIKVRAFGGRGPGLRLLLLSAGDLCAKEIRVSGLFSRRSLRTIRSLNPIDRKPQIKTVEPGGSIRDSLLFIRFN
jgi:hypothetical protein